MCGAVRYSATAKPANSMVCHCQSCRRSAALPGPLGHFAKASSFTRGTPIEYQSRKCSPLLWRVRLPLPLHTAHAGLLHVTTVAWMRVGISSHHHSGSAPHAVKLERPSHIRAFALCIPPEFAPRLILRASNSTTPPSW